MILKKNSQLQITLLILAIGYSLIVSAKGIYQEPKSFIKDTFKNNPPKAKTLWLNKELKAEIKKILGHNYHKLRLQYYQKEKRSAWIIDQIGKQHYITTGIVINDNEIEQIKILIFRESRGWEIRNDFFTNQFIGSKLEENGKLNTQIDNITGATLSVRAVKKQARMALYLHKQIEKL